MELDKMESKVVQITNICPNINVEQIKTFLGFVGRVEQLRLYPERMHFMAGGNQGTTKVCYAKFAKLEDSAVALHLTNTVFIDRALIVVPVESGIIPDETEGMKYATQTGGYSGYLSSNSANGDLFGQLNGPTPLGTDDNGYDELSRTIYVENLPAEAVANPELLLDFCSQMGEVKYVRLAGDHPIQAAFVEFSSQSSAQEALLQDGTIFCGQPIQIGLSNTLIHKPQLKSNIDAQKEIELAMEQVRRAESLITAHASVAPTEPVALPGSINKSVFRTRTRSRSREPSRSKRRSPTPPKRESRSKREPERESSRRKTRSRSPKERKRSKSRTPEKPRERRRSRSRERSAERRKERERSREREKEREREREKVRLEREKEKEREREEREREREREREKREKERAKEKERSRKDKDRSDDERTSHKKKHKKEKKRKHKDVSRSRSRDRESKSADVKTKSRRSKSPVSAGVKSPSVKSDAMDTSP